MKVTELNQKQLDQLKEMYVCEAYRDRTDCPSYSELAAAHDIPDAIVFGYYEGIDFVEEDFR